MTPHGVDDGPAFLRNNPSHPMSFTSAGQVPVLGHAPQGAAYVNRKRD